MKIFPPAAALLLLALVLLPAWSAPSEPQPLSVADVIGIETASQFDISPDGSGMVWVKRRPDMKKNKQKTGLMLTHLADTTTVTLTRGPANDYAPRFSPDGTAIAFLRDPAKGPAQLYMFDLRGGEPRKLTGAQMGVRAFAWRNAGTIVFSAPEDSTLRERTLAAGDDNTIVVADQEHYKPVRLFSVSIESKKIARLSENQGVITEFALSPDGRFVVSAENQDIDYRYDHRERPRQFLTDLETGERTELFTGEYDDPYDFQWAHDSSGFYCRRSHASHPGDDYVAISHLYFYSRAAGTTVRVDGDWDNGLGYAYRVVRDGAVAMCAGGTADRIVFYRKNGAGFTPCELRSHEDTPLALAGSARDGDRIVYGVSTASSVPEFMTARIDGCRLVHEYKLFDLNEPLKKKTLARSEVVSWRGARNDPVEGILYYPVPYDDAKRYPLVACIHGGPSGVDRNYFSERWSNYPHLLAGRGAFVLKVNYHGSGNYGLDWLESIKGNYYDLEVPDILAGIDTLIDRGLVDEDRLAMMGWSNGSILAIECCLRDARFKALCAGAGDVNWTSDYGNCAFGAAFDNAYFGGPPWELPDVYVEKSPLFRMREMKTPTLIMFGTRDTSVPTEQGWQHFRAMQQIGTTPVRFLLFPGSRHGLSTLAQQRRKMEEELAWFDRYLFLKPAAGNEAFDEKSPLALALARASAGKAGTLFGVRLNGVLVPEMVPFKGLRIGRFEVTRAQFKAYDPSYAFDPETGNLPANGISFEQARGYCQWLSGVTGTICRLPGEAEMKTLVDAARSNAPRENNLEYWAGYATTMDDRSLLAGKIAELERSRLLIEPVGSFAPVDSVYDLCGNVAEWFVTDEGTGGIRGLSAVSTRDKRTPYQPPRSAYVGFRVLEELPNE